MKIGFCLEGGAMKGLYTAGVLDYLMDKEFNIDVLMGVSAGALFGVNYKSGQKGRALRYNLNNCKNKNYMGLWSFITTGNIMNRKFCFEKIVYELDPFDFEYYRNHNSKFYSVVTNVISGMPEYILMDDLEKEEQMEYLRASGSMPFVSKMVKVNGNKYLDGALSDSIPLKKMEELGLDKIVVILTKPHGYRKKKHSSLITNIRYFRKKKLRDLINNRYMMYNKQMEYIEKLESEGKIFVLRPSKNIKSSRIEHDKEVLRQIYDCGVNDIADAYDRLIEFIEK